MKPNHIFNYLNRTPLHAFALNGGISAVIFEYKKHINEQDNDGNTPLHLAATVCRYKDIESLIQAGADVNSDRNDGKTPLHLTICSGLLENRLKALHLLIERGALINSQDQIGYTPLHIAMKLGDYDVAKELISLGADVLAPSYQKMTPLNLLENKDAVFSFIESIAKLITKTNVLNYFLKFICDCNFGSDCKLYDTIKTLVSCGADINTVLSSKDQNISSVLTLDNPALLRYILENDAGPLSKKISLSTLMKLAIKDGSNLSVDILAHRIKTFDDIDADEVPLIHLAAAQNPFNYSQNTVASRNKIKSKIEILLSAGFSPLKLDHSARTALHFAAIGGFIDNFMPLIEAGVNIDDRDNDGDTPLHYAAALGNAETFQEIYESFYANISARNLNGDTVLHVALKPLPEKLLEHNRQDSNQILEYFFQKHVAEQTFDDREPSTQFNFNACNQDGSAPIHIASIFGNYDQIILLGKIGVNLNLKNKSGQTPFHLAAQYGETSSIKALIELKADPKIQDINGKTALNLASENKKVNGTREFWALNDALYQ